MSRELSLEDLYRIVLRQSFDHNLQLLTLQLFQSFPDYQLFEEVTLTPAEADYSVIDAATMQTPLVVKDNLNQFAVIEVLDRNFVETTPDGYTDRNLERMYRIYTYLTQKVDSLRSESNITINSELFDEIYDL